MGQWLGTEVGHNGWAHRLVMVGPMVGHNGWANGWAQWLGTEVGNGIENSAELGGWSRSAKMNAHH